QLEAVRPGRGHLVDLGDATRRATRDRHYSRRVGDVDEEAIEPRVVDGPSRATRHGDGRLHPALGDVDHRERAGAGHRRIPDVGRVGDVETVAARVDGRVVERAWPAVGRKVDMAGQAQRHRYRAVCRWQNA